MKPHCTIPLISKHNLWDASDLQHQLQSLKSKDFKMHLDEMFDVVEVWELQFTV